MNKDTKEYFEDTALKLIRGCYYNPRHIPLIEAMNPPMPTATTKGLWSALLNSHNEGHVDTDAFERRGGQDAREEVTGIDEASPEYLSLTQHASDSTQLESWAAILKDAQRKSGLYKDLRSVVSNVGDHIQDRDTDVGEIISYVTRTVMEHAGTEGGDFEHIADVVEDALGLVDEYEEGGGGDIMYTGFPGFDSATGGFDMGEKSIIAGLSGSGKSTLAMAMVKRQARRHLGENQVVAVFSPEMNSDRFIIRGALGDLNKQIQDPQSIVTEQDLKAGNLTSNQYDAYRKYLRKMKDLNVWFCGEQNPGESDMRSALYRLMSEYEVVQVYVDYDEYIKQDGGNIEERVSNASKITTRLAEEVQAAWVDLSQYKTAAEERNDIPKDSDLRGSRQKWHDSALVAHIYWPHHWVRKGFEANEDHIDRSNMWLVVTKNRGGDIGRVPLKYYPSEYRYADPNGGSEEHVRPWSKDEIPF